MQVSDKLIKPLTEAKYLNADNVSRYRCIMRIFFEHYEKLKYWLYQEEVYEEMIQEPFFADYKPEQCQQSTTGCHSYTARDFTICQPEKPSADRFTRQTEAMDVSTCRWIRQKSYMKPSMPDIRSSSIKISPGKM